MKILITGASGFFGKSFVNALAQSTESFECFCVYKSNILRTSDKRFQWRQCDLLNIKETEQLIKSIKPTHLVHLAWHVPPQQFWTAFENMDWLTASINLFQAFCENDGKVFIGAGTLAEYDWANGILNEKETPLVPNTLYGQCKKSLYEILISTRNAHYPKTKIMWPRIGYFFGPYEPKEKLISKLIYNIREGLSIDLASADFKRPYAHVKYLGEVLAKLVMLDESKDAAFNLSASTSHPLKGIVDFMSTKLEKESSEIRYNMYPSIPERLVVKVDFLKSMNWEIPNTFFDDLELIIEE